MYVQHLSLSFHQISCRRSACGRACAGGEVIKLLAWGSVQHSQTTLMPCAAICQNELWSRILLIISQVGKKKKSLISRVFTCLSLSYSHLSCVVFTRETNKIWKAGIDLEIELLPQFTSHSLKKKLFSNSISQQMVSVSHSVCFCSYQAAVVFLKHFSVKYAKFPHRQTAPSQLQGFDK